MGTCYRTSRGTQCAEVWWWTQALAEIVTEHKGLVSLLSMLRKPPDQAAIALTSALVFAMVA
jgi:hypothetical protein